jgi:Histidine kinase-, DNA gyrase B-, and HSP90-like ATPase
MDITPSPRILRMLGEIEFDEWQCVAELVDNAFDDFTEIIRDGQSWPGGFKVSVTLPSLAANLVGAEVVVRDTGRGMTRAMLEQAVRAGWSSNDRFDKLGLFGMGFNVSTARLGRRSRVLTTRAGDPEWIGVEIDLDTIGADFKALDITEPKDDPSEHGTRVEISHLIQDRADWLRRNAASLRTTLGRVYGWLLENRPYELWIQGVKVTPRRACRWGDHRYVIYGSGASSEKIPAYIKIDKPFEPADACEVCGNWQNIGKDNCDQCGSLELRQRERHLHGWLGIQRHLDKRDFGIDFLRNGRKILQYDKRLFNWTNPNDPTAAVDVEYPVELANQGGRIIGEIHLDYVPVHYDKNAFEYSDRGWKGAVDYLRGEAPLQPLKAKAAGYSENASPLGLLFKGYRRNDAGTRYLIPGDGSRPLHEETRQWARKFWAGDPEYQRDEKWWDQVVSHDERQKKAKLDKATGDSASSADAAAVLAALGGARTAVTPASPASGTIAPTPPPAEPQAETVQERLVRYAAEGTILQELTRDFGLPGLGSLNVETRSLSGPILDASGSPTPIWLAQGAGGTATALVDASHDAFSKLGLEPADLLLAELSAALKVKADSELTHSQIAAGLRSACLPDTAIDPVVIRAQVGELLIDIRQRMADNVANDPQRALSYLDADEQTATENALIADGGDSLTATLSGSGRFLLYVPPLFLVKLLENWPEAFMDGRVFIGPYATLKSLSSKRLSLARVVGYLNDLATLLTFQTTPNAAQLRRTRLSVQLLQEELAPDQT